MGTEGSFHRPPCRRPSGFRQQLRQPQGSPERSRHYTLTGKKPCGTPGDRDRSSAPNSTVAEHSERTDDAIAIVQGKEELVVLGQDGITWSGTRPYSPPGQWRHRAVEIDCVRSHRSACRIGRITHRLIAGKHRPTGCVILIDTTDQP